MQLGLDGFVFWVVVIPYVFASSQQCLEKPFGHKVSHPTQKDTFIICLGKVGELEQKCAESFYFDESNQRCLKSRNELQTNVNSTDGKSQKCGCCQQQLIYVPFALPLIPLSSCACTCYEPCRVVPTNSENTTITPTTSESSTQVTTSELTTQTPTTSESSTQVTSELPTQTPTTSQSSTKVTTSELTTQTPTTSQSSTEVTTSEPTTQPPTTSESTTKVTSVPTTHITTASVSSTKVTTAASTTQTPITSESTTKVTSVPTTQTPTTSESSTKETTSALTTQKSTTSECSKSSQFTTTTPYTTPTTTTSCTTPTTKTPPCTTPTTKTPPCTTPATKTPPCTTHIKTTPPCTTSTHCYSTWYPETVYDWDKSSDLDYDEPISTNYHHSRPNIGSMLSGKCISIPPDCRRYFDGTFIRDNAFCNKYYICLNGRAIVRTCPRGLHFDDKIMACNYAPLVNCVNCKS